MNQFQSLRRRMVEIGKKIFENKLVIRTEGNISARMPRKNRFLVKATGKSLGNMQPQDFVIVDSEGKKIRGQQEPSIETSTHLTIYQNREDVNAIVHTHQMIATAFAVTGIEILPIWLRGIQFSDRIPVVEYHLPGSMELGKAILQKLNKHMAVLLQNHGVIVMGKDIEEAYSNALILEDLAKMQVLARIIGKPRVLTKKEIEETRELEEYHNSTNDDITR